MGQSSELAVFDQNVLDSWLRHRYKELSLSFKSMSSEVLSVHARGWKRNFEKPVNDGQLHNIILCAFLSLKLPSHSHFVTSEAGKFRICSMKSGLSENIKGKHFCYYGEVKTFINLNLADIRFFPSRHKSSKARVHAHSSQIMSD